jgi:hypothetical protein
MMFMNDLKNVFKVVKIISAAQFRVSKTALHLGPLNLKSATWYEPKERVMNNQQHSSLQYRQLL